MKTIAQMYEWSGGTDYRHTCYECRNCRQVKKGRKTVYQCQLYGEAEWKPSYIACKAFNQNRTFKKEKQEKQDMQGQMSLFDLFGE